MTPPKVTGGSGKVTPPKITGGGGKVTPPKVTGGGGKVTTPKVTGGGGKVTPPKITGGGGKVTPPKITGGGKVTPPKVTGGGGKVTPPKITGGSGKKHAEKRRMEEARKQISKLSRETKQKLNGLTAKAEKKQQQAKKPATKQGEKSKPGKQKPGKKSGGYALSGADMTKLNSLLGSSAMGKEILSKLKNGEPLTAAEIGYLQGIRTVQPPNAAGRLNQGTIDAALAENASNQKLQSITDQLAQLGGGSTVTPGDPGYPPQGVMPVGPAALFPVIPGEPAGPAIVTGIVPGPMGLTDEGSAELASELGNSHVDTEAVLTASSPLQTTRYLQIANATNEPITVYVQYCTPSQDGKPTWFPDSPIDSDEAVPFKLAPGESADVTDHDWRINATRARIWAKSKNREWTQFKGKDLWLVPEMRDSGEGYRAPEIGLLNFVIR